jgi:hypothetical protein
MLAVILTTHKMKYLVITIGLVLLIFFGLPDIVLYSKEGIERWFPFLIIILVLPFLVYKTLLDFKLRKDYALAISISTILIVGPSFGFWTENLSEKDLEKNGKLVEGIVFEKWQVKKHKSRYYKWLYKGEFVILDIYYYTFSEEDLNNSINEGDTLIIKYSKRNPENNKIIGLKGHVK